ncbi:MAG: transcriptional regulator [Acutalibacteraceae bacterium]|jgi:predicted transcriptional regulator
MDWNTIPEALTLPLRLKILCLLTTRKRTFQELKELTAATDGNISVQLSRLTEWNYISSSKLPAEKRRSSTIYEITPFGIRQLEEYVEFLQGVIH